MIGAIALAAACATISAHRARRRGARGTRWPPGCATGLDAIDGVQHLLACSATTTTRVAVATVHHRRAWTPRWSSAALSAEHGIGVRDGKFCAHLLRRRAARTTRSRERRHRRAGSVGLANTVEHVDRLLAAVAALAADGPAFGYERTPEGWVATEDPRDLSLPRPW